jgi:hypothetical protein
MTHPQTKGVAEVTEEAFLYWETLGWTRAPDDAVTTAELTEQERNPGSFGTVDPAAAAKAQAQDRDAAAGSPAGVAPVPPRVVPPPNPGTPG